MEESHQPTPINFESLQIFRKVDENLLYAHAVYIQSPLINPHATLVPVLLEHES